MQLVLFKSPRKSYYRSLPYFSASVHCTSYLINLVKSCMSKFNKEKQLWNILVSYVFVRKQTKNTPIHVPDAAVVKKQKNITQGLFFFRVRVTLLPGSCLLCGFQLLCLWYIVYFFCKKSWVSLIIYRYNSLLFIVLHVI